MSSGRRFARDLLVLFLPVAALLGVAEADLRGRPTLLRLRRQKLEALAPSLEAIVLGSSHELAAIDETRLGRPACNLAGASQSIWYSVRMLQPYLDRLARLRYVLLGVSYRGLEYQLAAGRDRGLRLLYYETFRIPPHDGFRLSEVLDLSLIHRLGIEQARRTLGERAATPQELTAKEVVAAIPQDEFDARAEGRVREHDDSMDRAWLEPNLDLIDGLAIDLARRGIELRILSCPVSDAYGARRDSARLARMREALKGLCARHGLAWHDYQDDARFSRADFTDLDHLRRDSAIRFTGIVEAEVLPRQVRDAPGAR